MPAPKRPLLVLGAGRCRSSTSDNPEKVVQNMRSMNEAALASFRAGHLAGLTVTVKTGERAGAMAAQREAESER